MVRPGADDGSRRVVRHRSTHPQALGTRFTPGPPRGDPTSAATARGVSGDPQETGVGPAPPETVALWVKRVATMRADEVDEFERRTFRDWHPASLGDLRRAIQQRPRKLAR